MDRRDMWRLVITAAITACLVVLLTGCMAQRTLTQTSRSRIEQLLLAGGARRAATRLNVPEFLGTPVYVEVAGLTKDAEFAGEIVASELQSEGALIVSEVAKATYVVKLLVLALGTDQTETFVGIPTMSGLLLPTRR